MGEVRGAAGQVTPTDKTVEAADDSIKPTTPLHTSQNGGDTGAMAEVSNKIRQFILNEFVYDYQGDAAALKNNASLLDESILDSMGILTVILFLEETFEITIDDREVVPDNLESIDGMAAFVQRKLGAAAG